MAPTVTAAVLLIGLANGIGCTKKAQVEPAASSTSGRVDTPPDRDAVATLRSLIAHQQWTDAEELLSAALISRPNDPDVLTEVALVHAKLGRLVEASELMMEAAVASDFDPGSRRIDNAVRALIDVGRLYDAIDFLERVVARRPTETKYRRMLIGFLGEAQLTERIDEHLEPLIRAREFDLPILVATTETFTRRFSEKTIEMILKRNPTDRRVRFGMARQAYEHRDAERAEEILRDILQSHPRFGPAYAMMGQVLVDQAEFGELQVWLEKAPGEAAEYSDYWLSQGDLAIYQDDLRGAAAAYFQAARRAPNSSLAWARLGTAMRRLMDREGSSELGDMQAIVSGIDKRSSGLLELRKRFHEFSGTYNRSQTAAVAVAAKLFELGRNWEAEAWSAIATTLTDDLSPQLHPQREAILKRLAQNRDWLDRSRFEELTLDLSDWPLPVVGARIATASVAKSIPATNKRPVMLKDEAVQRGIKFFGRTGDRVEGPMVPLAQTLGCGGGAIDYDNDGLTDLVLTGAGGSMLERNSHPGTMYRNAGGTFADVTAACGSGDAGFGQGVSVGDYNDDGFLDLFMLNLGANRLLRNNGDGTFTDVSLSAFGNLPKHWSASGAIIDVDGDGHCDLVAANYCDVGQPIDEPCFDNKTGQEIACHPLRFAAAEDEFFRNRGDGAFEDVSKQWVEEQSPGRGLGILAGKLDGAQMGIYVANDMTANNYYLGTNKDAAFELVDTAMASGVAVDAQTLTQASMGIAATDIDNDGDLDLYVTGFAREYNILYEQISPGSWADRTVMYDLVKPTLSMVGFGTVATDLDADGLDELVVSNGHIGEFGGDSPPYAQPLQLFRRTADGRFAEQSLSTWEPYFRASHVGRATWLMDADSDGRSDIVVTHATEPVSLLMNRSDQANRTVGFRLVGTRGPRDAIGAIVRLQFGATTSPVTKTLFQLAGSGYLCSHENILRCGVGPNEEVSEVTVTWPSGTQQTFGTLASQSEYLIVEGQSSAYELKTHAH